MRAGPSSGIFSIPSTSYPQIRLHFSVRGQDRELTVPQPSDGVPEGCNRDTSAVPVAGSVGLPYPVPKSIDVKKNTAAIDKYQQEDWNNESHEYGQ